MIAPTYKSVKIRDHLYPLIFLLYPKLYDLHTCCAKLGNEEHWQNKSRNYLRFHEWILMIAKGKWINALILPHNENHRNLLPSL